MQRNTMKWDGMGWDGMELSGTGRHDRRRNNTKENIIRNGDTHVVIMTSVVQILKQSTANSSHTKSVWNKGIGTNGVVVLNSSFLVAIRNASGFMARESNCGSLTNSMSDCLNSQSPKHPGQRNCCARRQWPR
eukprot:scaffold329948_cov22-Prasinocladus_malaysianus.AAC.1